MTTEQGNKLICEFMGLVGYNEKDHPAEYGYYDKQWNYLMPVVEKIGEYGVWSIRPGCVRLENWYKHERAEDRFNFSTRTMDWETEVDEPVSFSFLVWHVCVKFIQWFNQQETDAGKALDKSKQVK